VRASELIPGQGRLSFVEQPTAIARQQRRTARRGAIDQYQTHQLPPHVRAALDELKQALAELYGDQLRGVYLYGSYARGDFSNDSDIDLLIAVDGDVQPIQEMDRISPAVSEICLRYNVLIGTYTVPVDWLLERQNPFFANLRREAVVL
jgi:predicted nucleotidyltransferase